MTTSSGPTRTSSSQRRRQVLADEVGPDRQLAVAAVDEHRELHGLRSAVLGDGVERGAHGAAGEQHVVDEHDGRAVEARPGCRCARTARPAAARCRRGTARRRSSRPGRPARCARSRPPRRSASQTPPERTPSRTTPSRPRLRSRISWAMRVVARRMSSGVRTRLGSGAALVGAARHALFHGCSCRAGLTGPASRSGARVAVDRQPEHADPSAERRDREVLEVRRRAHRHPDVAPRSHGGADLPVDDEGDGVGADDDRERHGAGRCRLPRRPLQLAAVRRRPRRPIVGRQVLPRRRSSSDRRRRRRRSAPRRPARKRSSRPAADTSPRAAVGRRSHRSTTPPHRSAIHPGAGSPTGSHVSPSAAGSSSAAASSLRTYTRSVGPA